MRITKVLPVLMLAVCLMGLSAVSALAQTPYRAPDWQMKQLLRSTDNCSNAFRSRLRDALNHSSLNGTRREDTINKQAADLKRSLDHLKQDFDAHRSTRMDVEVVLSRAQVLNTFMRNHRMNSVAQNDWQSLRADLNQLASDYYVAWRWDQPSGNQYASWPNRMGQKPTRNLIDRLEAQTDMFSKDMPSALNRSSLNGTARASILAVIGLVLFSYSKSQQPARV